MAAARSPLVLLISTLSLLLGGGCATGTLTIDGAGDGAGADDDAADDDAADDDAADDDASDDDASDDDVSDDDAADDDAADDDTVDNTVYDGASLVITAPTPGYSAVAGDLAVRAEVRSSGGELLPFDAIDWNSEPGPGAIAHGAVAVLDDLPVGEHSVVASALLPNGEAVEARVDGIRMLSPYAGVYGGEVSANIVTDWFELPCAGESSGEVDDFGTLLVGEAQCAFGEDSTWGVVPMAFEAELAGGAFAGVLVATIDFGIGTPQEVDMALEGAIGATGALEATFLYDLYGYLTVDGAIEMAR
ncbi:hypothetical protein L6R50_07705 [Myxococcota bacterium]|nr:hypothetical protein [Myxococcota bacterium]